MASTSGAPASWSGADLMMSIHAHPGARKTEAAGLRGAALKLRLRARPVEGAANAALLDFLADAFQVSRQNVELLSGERSREKRVRVVGPDRAHAESVLRGWGIGQTSS